MSPSRTERMSPRERVVRALNHQEPDRVPIDLGGFQTGIHKNAYQALIDYLGLTKTLIDRDPVQGLVIPSETCWRNSTPTCATSPLTPPTASPGASSTTFRGGKHWYDLRDEFGVVWSMPEDQMLYMDLTHHPLARASIRDIEKYPSPTAPTRPASPVSARTCSTCADRRPTPSPPASAA